MKSLVRVACLFMLLLLQAGVVDVRAQEILGYRMMTLTLRPNYVSGTIDFDGYVNLQDPARALNLDDLPLNLKYQWHAEGSPKWIVAGTIRGGKLSYVSEKKTYHLKLEPFSLQPDDKLRLVLPFVNLEYDQIQPVIDDPDDEDKRAQQLTHVFSYAADDTGREMPAMDIPFTPVAMKVDLTLVPLIGEALAGKASGVRLYGSVQFENIRDFDQFSHYCQIAPERLKNGDYVVGHLLYSLDFPSSSEFDMLDPVYEAKPTRVALRSTLNSCNYDGENKVGQVQAVFSGRILSSALRFQSFPKELYGHDSPDGNYSFSPPDELKLRGVAGYQVSLGRITLAPEDVLTVAMPNTQVQAHFLQPIPAIYEIKEGLRIVYKGPNSFNLSLPYVSQSGLYMSQFPAFLRPFLSPGQEGVSNFYFSTGANLAWLALVLGILFVLLAVFLPNLTWLSVAGWLLITAAFYYGVRGSFGLFCVALLFYLTREIISEWSSGDRQELLQRLGRGLAGFAFIALGVYADVSGADLFEGLAERELSPLTPLVLMLLSIALLLLLYGRPGTTRRFPHSDVPVIILLLALLSLYDAFDKSLLSLLILFAGGMYITYRATQSSAGKASPTESKWGTDLRRRWRLAFGNRLVLLAILILMIFAILHDLSSTFANDMQARLSPLLAPLVIPLLVVISVFLTFASIALLFVLVYPYIPLKTGYLKAAAFALVLFLVFLFGIGTDDRLIASLPNILVGRVIYYLSVPMLLGATLDIQEFMRDENKRLKAEGEEKKAIDFRTASSMYFKNLQGMLGTLVGVTSLVAPTLYAFLSSQPVLVTYFSLLEKLLLLPT